MKSALSFWTSFFAKLSTLRGTGRLRRGAPAARAPPSGAPPGWGVDAPGASLRGPLCKGGTCECKSPSVSVMTPGTTAAVAGRARLAGRGPRRDPARAGVS
jgi:hypothetical protein